MKTFTFLLTALLSLTFHLPANEAQRRTVVGQVVSITVDDLSESFGITQDQERYPIRVRLDSVQRIVLGFGEPGEPITESQKLKLRLLLEALDNQYTVALRLDSVVTAEFVPTHARVIAVSVRP